jgi:hypothetical protein
MTFINTFSFKFVMSMFVGLLPATQCFAYNSCEIKGNEFTKLASNSGFHISKNKVSGEGSCTIRKNSVIAGANLTIDTICHFTFFTDLKFDNNITVKRIEFTKPVRFVNKYSGSNIEFTIEVIANKKTTTTITLHSITLSGDNCDDWQNSF